MAEDIPNQKLWQAWEPDELGSKVVYCPQARYFGAEMAERMLVPEGDAWLGEIRFEDWLNQPAVPAAVPAARS